jgi:hypothetical protein
VVATWTSIGSFETERSLFSSDSPDLRPMRLFSVYDRNKGR